MFTYTTWSGESGDSWLIPSVNSIHVAFKIVYSPYGTTNIHAPVNISYNTYYTPINTIQQYNTIQYNTTIIIHAPVNINYN